MSGWAVVALASLGLLLVAPNPHGRPLTAHRLMDAQDAQALRRLRARQFGFAPLQVRPRPCMANVTGRWVRGGPPDWPTRMPCPRMWRRSVSGLRREGWDCGPERSFHGWRFQQDEPRCLRPPDPEAFLHWLGNKTLRFSGDSILEQLYLALVCTLDPYVLSYVMHAKRHAREYGLSPHPALS